MIQATQTISTGLRAETKVKAGYKETELGVIPEDWNVCELGELTMMVTNGFVGTAKTHYTDADDGVTYIQGYNVEENSFNFRGIKKVTLVFHRQHQKSCLKEGDLLTVQTGDVGLTTIVPNNLEGTNCHALIISRFNKDKVCPKFYSYYFNSLTGRSRLKEFETGTTMKHLNIGDIVHWKIPFPKSKSEQVAIATILSDTDELIEGLEKLIVKKKALKQGAMQQLLTGKKRLPGFSGEWVVKKLGEVGKCYRGVSYNPSADLYAFDGDSTFRLLRSNNVQGARIVFSDMQFVDSRRVSAIQRLVDNDILICMANGSKDLVGKAGRFYANDSYAYTFGAFMGCFRPNRQAICSDYVFYLFQTERYKNHIMLLLAGSSINNLRPTDLEDLSISIPLQQVEQVAIATILSDMDAEIDGLEQKRDNYIMLKHGMIQQLLTGKIRLI